MMHDIFATSMAGSYETRAGEELLERGSWNYRGYGNAEIAMHAEGESADGEERYRLDLHSVERQVDDILLCSWIPDDENVQGKFEVRVAVAGHELNVSVNDGDGDAKEGVISVPDETIYDGPSPIWLIHLMMVSPMPADRVVTTPFVRFGLNADEVRGGFYRVARRDSLISMTELDEEGVEQGTVEIELADDGVPMTIRDGAYRTDVVRIPQA